MLGTFLACGIVGLAWWASPGAPDGPADYLTPGGNLAGPLTLRIGQSGFAGVTGTVWAIEPSGRWTASKFLDTGQGEPRVSEPHARGELDRQQLVELARVLAAQDFTALPERIGDGPEVNPSTVAVSFGATTKTLDLAPGTELAEATAPPGIAEGDRALYDRFLAVARALDRCVRRSQPN